MIKGRAAYFLDVNEQDVVKVHLNYVMVVCYLGAMEQYSWIKWVPLKDIYTNVALWIKAKKKNY